MPYKFFKRLINLPGWRTNRKIIVIESDDWGSIRMPSNTTFAKLKNMGLPIDSDSSGRYNLYDTLESSDDFDALFNLLTKFKNSNGVFPVVTALAIVANPDFDKIKASNFASYFYEPFTITHKRYGNQDIFEYWKEGKDNKIFIPEFHGREHLNVPLWMRALQQKDKFTLLAFDEGFWGFRNKRFSSVNYQAAFDLDKAEDIDIHKDIISSGLRLFEEMHSVKASYFVPPNGPLNLSLAAVAESFGIEFISSAKKFHEPLGNNRYRLRFNYLGKRLNHKQIFVTRNCLFEPSYPGIDWISSCLKDINSAFSVHKPAVISTHRVNYIGTLSEGNRKSGIEALGTLLKRILDNWPDVEFLTSSELGRLIKTSTFYD